MSSLKLYYISGSLSCAEARRLVEDTGLSCELVDVSKDRRLQAALDRDDGIYMFPTLTTELRCGLHKYIGLERIRTFASAAREMMKIFDIDPAEVDVEDAPDTILGFPVSYS